CPLAGLNAAGCSSLDPNAAGQTPLVLTSGPFCAVEYLETTCGRPLFMSTWVAQFTFGSYFSATSSAPLVRSSVYPKPLRSKCTSALVILPLTGMSARIISLMPSKSHSSNGVIWYTHFTLPVSTSRAQMDMLHLLSPGRCAGFQVLGLPVP